MNKKEKKTLKDLSYALQKSDGIVMVLVYSAGVGRMQFKATFADDVDRQDGDDYKPSETYDTPGDALRALASRLDRDLSKEGWESRLDQFRVK